LGQGEVEGSSSALKAIFFAGALTKSLYPNALNHTFFAPLAAAKALTPSKSFSSISWRGAVPLTKPLLQRWEPYFNWHNPA